MQVILADGKGGFYRYAHGQDVIVQAPTQATVFTAEYDGGVRLEPEEYVPMGKWLIMPVVALPLLAALGDDVAARLARVMSFDREQGVEGDDA